VISFDMPPQIGERSAEANVVVHEHVLRAAPDRPIEFRWRHQPLECRSASMPDFVGLHDFARHRLDPEAACQNLRHRVRNRVEARRLLGHHRQQQSRRIAHDGSQAGDSLAIQQVQHQAQCRIGIA
jgi:hypothetical protein